VTRIGRDPFPFSALGIDPRVLMRPVSDLGDIPLRSIRTEKPTDGR